MLKVISENEEQDNVTFCGATKIFPVGPILSYQTTLIISHQVTSGNVL